MGVSSPKPPKADIPDIFKPSVLQALEFLVPQIGLPAPEFPGALTAPLSNQELLALGRMGERQIQGANLIAPTTGAGAFGGADVSQVLRNLGGEGRR